MSFFQTKPIKSILLLWCWLVEPTPWVTRAHTQRRMPPLEAPQLALRLFRALVERLRDGIHQLTASQLACIARVHVRHWQVRKASRRARASVCVHVFCVVLIVCEHDCVNVCGCRRERARRARYRV